MDGYAAKPMGRVFSGWMGMGEWDEGEMEKKKTGPGNGKADGVSLESEGS
jgi:hypothetical protein